MKAPGSVTPPTPALVSPETRASSELAGASGEATTTTEMTPGEIRKIDKATQKITIKHGEIKNLGMPPMTMVFQVKDLGALETLNVGDLVRFTAEKSTSGGYVLTSIVRGK